LRGADEAERLQAVEREPAQADLGARLAGLLAPVRGPLPCSSQRPFLLGCISEATGLVPEVRAEGIALLDPSGEATDLRMLEESTHGHATLLLAERLAGALRQHGQTAVPLTSLHAAMAGWIQEHRAVSRTGGASRNGT
jgi:hypothetical protein